MAPSIAHIVLALVLYVFITTAQIRQVTTLKVKLGSCPMELDFPLCDTEEPKRECEMDGDCRGGLKCCQSGCGTRCVLALQDKRGSCPSYNTSACALQATHSPDECHQDLQCPGSERCCCIDCVRKCTATVKVKPGQCPPERSPCPARVQTNRCQKDGDCTGRRKCCNLCGKKCLNPTRERAGFCPVSTEPASCVATPDKPLCVRDIDCLPRQKCCLSMNRMECMEPMTEKNGVCPASELKCIRPPPAPLCRRDSDCPGDKKCCSPLCRMECTEPITDKPGMCPDEPSSALCPSLPSRCFKDFQCPGGQKCCIVDCRLQCTDPFF